MPKRLAFITPAAPVLKRTPPVGPQWIHEVKFDGCRVQLHKAGDTVATFSRNGIDLARRFAMIRDRVLRLPAESAIIDAELVACDSDGRPDFNALMNGQRENLCAWCFDLLELNGRDLRTLPLVERKAELRDLLSTADDDALRYSDEFDDPERLLAVATKMGLEGILSKLGHQPYKSGKNVGWVKVKADTWRTANAERRELFEEAGRSKAAEN
jgi:bifunctional non-homologous end joining protein LigD